MNNSYNSPNAMISRGLNPFVQGSADDREGINCVISRHCQTISERQAVLQQLASEKSELTKYAESMLAEQKSEPAPASAPDAAAQ